MFLDRIQESPSLELINLVLKLKAEGREVVSLAVGDPSFDTPREIIEFAHQSMLRGETHYIPGYGTMDVREAIVRKVRRKNGISATVPNTIFMATKMAVYVSLASISSEPFEALMPDPGYFYSEPIILAGGKPVRYRLAGSAFEFDLDEVKKKVSDKTKAIITNTPSNPTGRVMTRAELKELYDFCISRGMCIISDEAYEDLVYGRPHISVGSMEKRPETVISLYSLSKSYSMTGWRAGYIVAGEERVATMNRFIENALTCFPPFVEHAAAFALDNGDAFIERFRKEYVKRKHLLEDRISEIPALSSGQVEGSFYSFPSYNHKLRSRDLCRRLLENKNVALLPGSVFGPLGEKHMRICFAASEETIEKAMDGLKEFFSENS